MGHLYPVGPDGGEYVLAQGTEGGHLLAQLSAHLLGTHQPIWSFGHCLIGRDDE